MAMDRRLDTPAGVAQLKVFARDADSKRKVTLENVDLEEVAEAAEVRREEG